MTKSLAPAVMPAVCGLLGGCAVIPPGRGEGAVGTQDLHRGSGLPLPGRPFHFTGASARSKAGIRLVVAILPVQLRHPDRGFPVVDVDGAVIPGNISSISLQQGDLISWLVVHYPGECRAAVRVQEVGWGG